MAQRRLTGGAFSTSTDRSWAGSGLSTLSYCAMGFVRENATSFSMQRILSLQLSHSPWLHSKDLHSNSHCESSGGVFAAKDPLIQFLNPSNGLAISTPSWRNVALIDNSPYYSSAAQPHFALVRGIPWNIRSAVVGAIHLAVTARRTGPSMPTSGIPMQSVVTSSFAASEIGQF